MKPRLLRAAVASLAIWSVSVVAIACDTPVYRYAMYRWFPTPYEVYCFHETELGDNGKAVEAAIKKVSEQDQARANIVFLPVDLSDQQAFERIPNDIRDAWQQREDKSLPQFLISTPKAHHFHFGPLSVAQIPELVDSPARQAIGRQLEQGKVGVFVLVHCSDAEKNAAASKEIQSVMKDVASGEIPLYTSPPVLPSGEADAEIPKKEVGLVEVKRDDPKEKWLVDCILSLEDDLKERDDPISVLAYGRGRALPPCLGAGIHRENLLYDIQFITGACSCTVKEQNPGVDLLISYNWEAASEALSAQYGAEEGSRYQFGGDALFPELIIPAENEVPAEQDNSDVPQNEAAAAMSEAAPANAATDDNAPSDKTGPATKQPAAGLAGAEGATDPPGANRPTAPAAELAEPPATASSSPPAEQRELASAESSMANQENAEETGSSSPFRGVLLVGLGLIAALVVLFGATLLVLRPK